MYDLQIKIMALVKKELKGYNKIIDTYNFDEDEFCVGGSVCIEHKFDYNSRGLFFDGQIKTSFYLSEYTKDKEIECTIKENCTEFKKQINKFKK